MVVSSPGHAAIACATRCYSTAPAQLVVTELGVVCPCRLLNHTCLSRSSCLCVCAARGQCSEVERLLPNGCGSCQERCTRSGCFGRQPSRWDVFTRRYSHEWFLARIRVQNFNFRKQRERHNLSGSREISGAVSNRQLERQNE